MGLSFHREGEKNDFTLPNFEFFQNIDLRIQQLMDRGIQADLILFHPYDRWGYAAMGKEMNEKYVSYIMARLSAFQNVWWSLANEWDVPKIKEAIDWEGLGTLLQKEDTEIVLSLKGKDDYELEAFDTWNMKTLESRTMEPGKFTYKTPGAYTALRLTAK